MPDDLLREKIIEILKERKLSVSQTERLANIGNSVLRNFLAKKTKSLSNSSLSSLDKLLGTGFSNVFEAVDYGISWDYDLFLSSLNFVNDFVNKRKIKITLDQLLNIVREIFVYTQKNKKQTIDTFFAEWCVVDRLKHTHPNALLLKNHL
jgi:hypothetical protein